MPAIVAAQRFGTDRSIDKGISTLEVVSLPLSAASCPTAPAVVPYRFWAELVEPSGPPAASLHKTQGESSGQPAPPARRPGSGAPSCARSGASRRTAQPPRPPAPPPAAPPAPPDSAALSRSAPVAPGRLPSSRRIRLLDARSPASSDPGVKDQPRPSTISRTRKDQARHLSTIRRSRCARHHPKPDTPCRAPLLPLPCPSRAPVAPLACPFRQLHAATPRLDRIPKVPCEWRDVSDLAAA
jgi:hypothetical protein